MSVPENEHNLLDWRARAEEAEAEVERLTRELDRRRESEKGLAAAIRESLLRHKSGTSASMATDDTPLSGSGSV